MRWERKADEGVRAPGKISWELRTMRRLGLLLLVGLLILAGSLAGNAQKADKPKPVRVLLVSGQDITSHDWRLTGPVLAAAIRKDPRIEVNIVENPKILATRLIDDYDAIVLHFMNWQAPDPGPEARANLKRFVAGGKGLVLVHFACGAFQEWPEFVQFAGRVWDPKMRAHDPRGEFKVEIADPQHPITHGLKSFETVDELYTCLTGDVPIHVVAQARSKVDGKDYPMAFTLSFGKGRVFHCVLGHDVQAINNPVGELYRRGCAWVAKLELN